MEIRVDKHVPLPPRAKGMGREPIYPWTKLGVGDSFAFPKKVKRATASALTYRTAKTKGLKLALRVMENGEIRVWRTK